MKITPFVREEAAAYCSAMAAWFGIGYVYADIPDWVFSRAAIDLADEAYFVASTYSSNYGAQAYLEAEALLQSGWTL